MPEPFKHGHNSFAGVWKKSVVIAGNEKRNEQLGL
jgi:hypothetical protein